MLFFKNTPIPTCLIVFILQPFTLNYLPGNQPPFHVLPLHIRNRATFSLFIIWIFTQLYNIIEIHYLHSIFIFQHNSIICNFFYYSISSSIACLPTASGRLKVLYAHWLASHIRQTTNDGKNPISNVKAPIARITDSALHTEFVTLNASKAHLPIMIFSASSQLSTHFF